MKLLLDANISRRLLSDIDEQFPDSSHVASEGLDRATDEEIWDFALSNEYVIVSKDEDFHQRSLLDGPPPKVIWVRLGNCSTDDIKEAILRSHDFITSFVEDRETSFLSLE